MGNTVQRRLLEIERDLLGDAPLATCLRKCVALGADLRSAPLRDWANRELMGYGPDDQVPEYRVVAATILGDGETMRERFTGLPIGIFEFPDFARDDLANRTEHFELTSGIRMLAENAEQADRRGDGTVQMGIPMGNDLIRMMGRPGLGYVAIYWAISTSVFRGVLDQVRTTAVAILSELRAELPDDGTSASQAADQAVNVVVHGGRRNTVTVMTNRSHSGDAVVQPAAAGDGTKWAKQQTFWAIVGVLVAIVGAYLAYRQWKG